MSDSPTTSNPPNLFTGDRAALADFDLDSPIAGHPADNHVAHYEAFRNAAKAAETKGEIQSAAVFAFLSALTGFSESFDTPQTPFAAFFVAGDRRSAIPTDLTAEDVEALRLLAPQATDPALRARLHDVLWVLKKDVTAGQEAARAYVIAGKLQDNDENWTYALGSFKRALQFPVPLGDQSKLISVAARSLHSA